MPLYYIETSGDKAVERAVLGLCRSLPVELGVLRLKLRERFKCRLISKLTPRIQKTFNSASQHYEYMVLEVVHGMILRVIKKKGGQISSL